MPKLRGQAKTRFVNRMKRARAAAARRRSGGAKRKKKATRRRVTTSRKKPAVRRRRKAPARKAPTRRRRKAPEGVLTSLVKHAVPTVGGIVLAGTVARAVPAANTPIKRAAVTGGAAVLLSMAARFVSRNVPLRVVTPTAVKAMAAGMMVDSVFRGSTNIRGNLSRLPDAARRPGGILAGKPPSQPAATSASGAAMAAMVTRHA